MIMELRNKAAKAHRIKRLTLKFEQGRMCLPERLSKVNHQSLEYDLISVH